MKKNIDPTTYLYVSDSVDYVTDVSQMQYNLLQTELKMHAGDSIVNLTTTLYNGYSTSLDSLNILFIATDSTYTDIVHATGYTRIDSTSLVEGYYIVYTKTNTGLSIYFRLNVTSEYAGINDYDLVSHANMLVYPNPTSVNTKVKFYASDINTEVNIYSMTGELVYSNNDTRIVGKMNEIDVNVYDFKQGVYFVKIDALSKRLVIQ